MPSESKPVLTAQTEKPNHYSYLKEFRVEQCPLFLQHKCTQHRPFTCFHWHFMNQRRRRPVRKRDGSFNYSPDTYCTKYDETTGLCPDGDDCPFLHRTAGDTERRYHLRYYKTCMCVHDTDARGLCVKNGAHCAFAHGNPDLRPPVYDIKEIQALENPEGDSNSNSNGPNALDKEGKLLTEDPKWQDTIHVLTNYKTEPCKRPPRLCRQGYACPQYHNSRDKRRSPHTFKYRYTTPYWLQPKLKIDLSVKPPKKQDVPVAHLRTQFCQHLEDNHKDRFLIFTDGSKCAGGVSSAFYCQSAEFQQVLNKSNSIFSVELMAIFYATEYIKRTNINNITICSDSLSSLHALEHDNNAHPMCNLIVENVMKSKKDIVFTWVPSHVGIHGNERADLLATQALGLSLPVDLSVDAIDLKRELKKTVINHWNSEWLSEADNKLRSLKDNVHPIILSSKLTRREQVAITRLRLGHTHLTHSFLMDKSNPPICDTCQQPLTVKHILDDCRKLTTLKSKLNLPTQMSLLLNNDHTKIIHFLKEAKLLKFLSTPCPNVKHGDEWGEPGNCESGDLCQYCHTRTEQQFHPEIYKSTKCNDVQQAGYCPRGVFCAFAHVDTEMANAREMQGEGGMPPSGGAGGLSDLLSSGLPNNNLDDALLLSTSSHLSIAEAVSVSTIDISDIHIDLSEAVSVSTIDISDIHIDLSEAVSVSTIDISDIHIDLSEAVSDAIRKQLSAIESDPLLDIHEKLQRKQALLQTVLNSTSSLHFGGPLESIVGNTLTSLV
ncbi:hypothetical protein WDU94_006674 [Cyamophila willieti]